MTDFYELLEVERTASEDEIKKASVCRCSSEGIDLSRRFQVPPFGPEMASR